VVDRVGGPGRRHHYIPLLLGQALQPWVLPGAVLLFTDWLGPSQLLLVQWVMFIVLALVFVRLPGVWNPFDSLRPCANWRASNLARRQV